MDLQYATMGSSLIPLNPLAGGIATGIGLGVDAFMSRENNLSQLAQTKDYNEAMLKRQPTIYDQPGGFKQTMPGLKKGGQVKGQKGIAFRSRKPAGHIIPADKVPEAQEDARNAGARLARIPGQGSPTADDRMLQVPGAQPVRVSSGEAFVSDDEFGEMARMAGMDRASYQMKMYPKAKDRDRDNDAQDDRDADGMAQGGQIDWNPPMVNPPGSSGYQPIGFGPQMSVLGQFAQGQTPGLPVAIQPPTAVQGQEADGYEAMKARLATGAAPGIYKFNNVAQADAAMGMPSLSSAPTTPFRMKGMIDTPPPSQLSATEIQAQQESEPPALPAPQMGGGTDPAKQPGAFDPSQPAAELEAATLDAQKSVTAAGLDDGSMEKSFQDMQQQNDRAAYGQLVPTMLSMAHNLTSRRVAGRPPMAYQPTMLDLNTEGLQAGLNESRQRATATAAQNSRGEQSQSRNLGIGANDQAARIGISSTVQGVKNQETQANVGISNQAKQINAQRMDQFEAGEAAGTNDWKLRKGSAIQNDLAAASAIVGGHAQGNIEINANKQLFGFQKRLYDTLSGVPSSKYATPTSVFTGNKADESQPDQAANSLIDPAVLQMMLMYGGAPRGRRVSFTGITPYRQR